MRWLILTSCLAACGSRNDRPPPAGTEGGPCYANGTCNSDLVCTSGLCVSPDLCAEVDCSGHGTCVMRGFRLSCQCDDGFQSVGLTCVPGCPTTGCTQCPDDMVLISAQDGCIDRYEATVFENFDCSGARYGAGWDDFPPTFPDLTASPGCEGTCAMHAVTEPTIEVYACSVADVQPTSHITWFQARRACHAVGKRLCAVREWASACQGPDAFTWPYGNAYDAGACNGGEVGRGGPVPTGEYSDCEGGYLGLYDMSGNLWEWLEEANNGVVDVRNLGGGDFGSYGGDAKACDTGRWNRDLVDVANEYYGFRCCK